MTRKTTTPTKSIPELQDMLRDAGLRSTVPRIAVLRYLHGAEAPTSHGDISDVLMKRGFDRATLYRNLIDLTDAGVVTRTDLGDHVWRFELKRGEGDHNAEHPHFVCTGCGDIACLPEVGVQFTASAKAPRALRSKGVTVQIKGRCDACT